MSGSQPALTMLLAGASDALCLEVSANLARALDRDPTAADGDADWSTEAGDTGGQPRRVAVSRLPFQREDPSRRRRLLADADVIVVVADATDAAVPVAIAGLADVRTGLGDRPCPVMLFGIEGATSTGLEPDELRRQLELSERDVVLVGSSNDRARLRQMFAFALRAALGTSNAPAAPAPAAAPAQAAPAQAAVAPAPPMSTTPAPTAPGGRVPSPDISSLAPPVSAPAAATATAVPDVQVFGHDDAYVEAVLHPGAVSERGSVEISSAHWEALAELVGEIALIRGSGDVRREGLMRELIGAGLMVDRRALADTSDGVDLFNQPVASAPVSSGGAETASASPTGDPSDDDRFRALKELRRQLLG